VSEQASRPRLAPLPAVDRALVVADVLSFAKKDCSRCRGAGFYISIFHKGAAQESREPHACRCAVARLKKQHSEDIVLVNGAPFWKPGRAPALPMETTTEQPRSVPHQ
jgi:hypothetical protein